MSTECIFLSFKSTGLTASEKLVLLVLSEHADEEHMCWPSQRRLAEYSGLSKRTISSVLASLEAQGFVTREPIRREDGSRSSDMFTLHFPAHRQRPVKKRNQGATIAGGVVQPLHGGGATIASQNLPLKPPTEPHVADATCDGEEILF